MRKRGMIIACALLGALLIIAAGTEGVGRFTGLRWIPTQNSHPAPPPPQPSRPLATKPPSALTKQGLFAPGLLVILMWVAIGVLVVAGLLLLLRWLARRRANSAPPIIGDENPTAPSDDPLEPPWNEERDAPIVRRGVEQALILLDGEREPRDAIVKAWVGMQENAEDAGITRRPAETPTEFTSRILQRVGANEGSVKTLLSLYLRVRFGDKPATTADVDKAREALTELAASWKVGTRG